MKTFIIYILLEILPTAREIFVYRDEQNIIDTFQDFGVILEANITHQSSNAHLCQIIQQKLINLMQKEIFLVPLINERVFNSSYFNGSLEYVSPYYYIVSMVPIKNGAIILFSDGHLTYIQERDNNIIKIYSNYQIFKQPSQLMDPVQMFYLISSHQLVILLQKQIIQLQLNNNESNIFGNYSQHTDEKILNTQNIKLVDDHLFIQGLNELTIYSLNKEGFEEVSNSKIEMNIIDIQVQRENDVYYIFFLHILKGVKVYLYDPIYKLLNEIQSFDAIPYNGYKFGLYQHILLIADKHDNKSIINELHYSKQNNQWTLFNKYQVRNTIKDILFTENYAILLGNNGHEIIYHSLPTFDYQIQNQIIIPGLQQIYLLNSTEPNNQSLIGITKHTYFISKFYVTPQKISCQYNEDLGPIQFTYYQNSTQCSKLPQKIEGQLCLFISNYTVFYTYPIITSEDKLYIYIVVFFLALILVILIGKFLYKQICYPILNKMRDYTTFPSNNSVAITPVSAGSLDSTNKNFQSQNSTQILQQSQSISVQSPCKSQNIEPELQSFVK